MKIFRQSEKAETPSIQYHTAVKTLSVIVIILAVLVTAVPGVMRMLYRIDANGALGNAKLVRLALQTEVTESYGWETSLGDIAGHGGISDEAYQEVLKLTKVPGDFWVLQVSEDRTKLLRFIYQEGDYLVVYNADPLSYQVYRGEKYIDTNE